MRADMLGKVVTFSNESGGYSVLRCPNCGGRNTHQSITKVFDRVDDDDVVLVTSSIAHEQEHAENAISGNPSLRRHGLRILVNCEGCPAMFWLCVAQHKGETHTWTEDAPAGVVYDLARQQATHALETATRRAKQESVAVSF